ncbi:G patch domain and KOW motifs-containing protein [Orchesella cincta]|uniref:G patch domain and KOW motifs-containing protein n=1 Tax=Orchesella cincta TaxID=48709 RepID=A0A1D2NGL1_ORCCI|nr:G patch domain and KOW motifs-containing protein [Orchesella cincta]
MLSFKITKKSTSGIEKKSVPQPTKRAFNDDNDKDEEEPDFIDGLDGNIIVSKKQTKVEKRELVIPLITKNEWRIDNNRNPEKKMFLPSDIDKDNPTNTDDNTAKAEASNGTSGDGTTTDLKLLAVKELLEEASSIKSSNKKNNSVIPILFQNKVPDGYEEDDNMDVSLRPDQSSLDDYERIPIDQFGLAMLRGMGWKETEGIGLKNKKVIDMTEPKLRPKGMGLGAEAAHLNTNTTPKNSSAEEKEDLSFKIGGHAVITRGSKKGYYGQIESFDEDNNRVILRLAISGKMEAVSKFYMNVVSPTEYKKNSKVVNIDKYEEYHNNQKNNANHQPDNKISRRETEGSSNSSDEEREYTDSTKDRRDELSKSKHKRHDKDKDSDRRAKKEKRADKNYVRDDRNHDNRHDSHQRRRSNERDRSDSSYRTSSRSDDRRKDSRHSDHRDRRKHKHSSRD